MRVLVVKCNDTYDAHICLSSYKLQINISSTLCYKILHFADATYPDIYNLIWFLGTLTNMFNEFKLHTVC